MDRTLDRLASRDLALFVRWALGDSPSSASLFVWTSLTHAGGIAASVSFALVPLMLSDGRLRVAALQACVALAVSQLLVQMMKRTMVRTRPHERSSTRTHVVVPDRFSFPSGHAAAAMSVAFIHATAFPFLAPLLLALAVLIGLSRVRLGVHFPGDVLVGQLVAIATGIVVRAAW
ncbi:MAG: phosphatase PAP2 family protein [Gemmatimonadales bacterium]